MPPRRLRFVENNHREHRTRNSRRRGHRKKRLCRLKKGWLMRKALKREKRERFMSMALNP